MNSQMAFTIGFMGRLPLAARSAAVAVAASCLAALGFADGSGAAAAAPPRGDAASSSAMVGDLYSVAASSADDIWAVGNSGYRVADNGKWYGTPHPLILHWNGVTWSRVTGIKPMTGQLDSVFVTSPSDAWAVGETYETINSGGGITDEKTLILHWNGRTWRSDTSAPVLFGGLCCVTASASQAWSVGQASGATTSAALALHWTGGRWYVVPINSPRGTQLTGVTATGPDAAWAVGDAIYGGALHGVLLRWSGSEWHAAQSLMTGNGTQIYGISGGPGAYAWMYGAYKLTTNETGISVLWTGKAWRTAAIPGNVAITSVGSVPGRTFWAVGYYMSYGGPTNPTLIMRWSGTAWSLVKSPNVAGSAPQLTGVAATSKSNAWAVGWMFTPSGIGSLIIIMHWNGKSWTIA
jgi:hypothetical protein